MKKAIFTAFIISAIFTSCNKLTREKLSNHNDSLAYLSQVLKDSINVNFPENQVLSYNLYYERSEYGQTLDKENSELTAKSLLLARESLAALKKYGMNSVEYLGKDMEVQSLNEHKQKLGLELNSPMAYTGLVNEINLMVIGEDKYKYFLVFDRDLRLKLINKTAN